VNLFGEREPGVGGANPDGPFLEKRVINAKEAGLFWQKQKRWSDVRGEKMI
jgi:hypothetical protein